MRTYTRRSILTAVGAVAALPAASRLLPEKASPSPYVFFDAAEARFIEAACERLIPADASGPGAMAAGVPQYLDRHLAGPWGAGTHLYRDSPWQAGTPAVIRQPRVTPAQVFRTALSAARRDSTWRDSHGRARFDQLSAAMQESYLHHLAGGGGDLDGVPSTVFFQMLLSMTVEGFFSDPAHSGTRYRVAWSVVGFPGAHAATTRVSSPFL